MNCNPKVNIITPVYNGEKYSDRFYKSIREIEYDNISFILVNDGSVDGTDKLLAELSTRDSRITYIKKSRNEGVSKARNDALRIADGKYCFFFDCDDVVAPSIVKNCVECAENNQYDAVLYIVNNVSSEGEVRPFDFRYEKDTYLGSEVIETVAKSLGISMDELKGFLRGKRSAYEGKQRNGPVRMMYRLQVIKQNALSFLNRFELGKILFLQMSIYCIATELVC